MLLTRADTDEAPVKVADSSSVTESGAEKVDVPANRAPNVTANVWTAAKLDVPAKVADSTPLPNT